MEKKVENKQQILEKGWFTMCCAETLGTGILIFIGCMGCVNKMSLGPVAAHQGALTFGMTVNLIIMMLGHISGAHLNPAVTIGAVILGLKNIATGVAYVVSQFIGATIGYWLLMKVTPEEIFTNSSTPICVTVIHPDIDNVQATIIEILCTSFILLGACATWDPRCAHTNDSTAIRFGFAVVALSLAASPYTGCSMNPARSFGPAYWLDEWKDQWVYHVGPTLGAILGTLIYKLIFLESNESIEQKLNITKLSKLMNSENIKDPEEQEKIEENYIIMN